MLAPRIEAHARPIADAADLDPIVDAVGDRRVVLLGEASHGTHDFYRWRAELTERLVREKGFRFVAVEGDWPECAELDEFIQGRPSVGVSAFRRWPTWMWGNREVEELAVALHELRASGHPVSFHGLDVYSLAESLDVLAREFPGDVSVANALRCFDGLQHEGQEYGQAAIVGRSCEREAAELLARMTRERLDAEQNALVVRNAEAYYRAMVRGGPQSWNVRDRHMQQTLERLVDLEGKGIVWAHNTHVGDARYTDMPSDGMVNLGQLARERFGEDDVFILGFTSHRGHVIASARWEGPIHRMRLPHAKPNTWDAVLHEAHPADFAMLLDWARGEPELMEERGQRAVGVVYHPHREWGNYVPTVLPRRYDAVIHVDASRALHPLDLPTSYEEPPQTFPFGE